MVVLASSLAMFVGPVSAKPNKEGGKGGPPPASEKSGPGANKKKGAAKGAAKVQPKGKVKGKKGGHQGPAVSVVRFNDTERRGVVSYFRGYEGRDGGLPPGIAKRMRDGKRLPPGWQSKLQPGYVLDDVWMAGLVPVSADLFPGMPYLGGGNLYVYGDRLIRLDGHRHEVVEVVVLPTVVIDL